jgi:hypothetical protein
MEGKPNCHEKFLHFRKKHPEFVFEGVEYSLSKHGLDIRFHFHISGDLHFYPNTFIPRKPSFRPDSELHDLLPPLIFHLGMIELISYWKATCSPQVVIRPYHLDPAQIAWWKDLYFNGLGEFFYRNGIPAEPDTFMEILPLSRKEWRPAATSLAEEVIIPVGGGKDSVVTMELIGKRPGTLPLIINPRGASVHSIFTGGFSRFEMIDIHRSIDPLLLELNDNGYLNGHTPFSALLAFTTLLAAVMTGKRYIALSNESSANEATIPGLPVNHQYSKTVEFEENFRRYASGYLVADIDYFSFLRPLNEIQIAGLFSRYPAYFPVFKSCNAGSKTDSWCCRCAKCLFIYIILSPFLSPDELQMIFRKNLLDDMDLKHLFDQLTGIAPEKPFECVGTIGEVNAALIETIGKMRSQPLPALLSYYAGLPSGYIDSPPPFHIFLRQYDTRNYLPAVFGQILKSAIYG